MLEKASMSQIHMAVKALPIHLKGPLALELLLHQAFRMSMNSESPLSIGGVLLDLLQQCLPETAI